MSIIEIVTLSLAIYGSVFATFLGVREYLKDRRRISVILEYVAWYEHAQITITNVGHRPITITEIGMEVVIPNHEPEFWDRVPRNALFDIRVKDEPFPFTIGDGEHMTFPLSPVVSGVVLEGSKKVRVSVYDVEGNEYTRFTTRLYDPKWGRYDKMR